MAKRAGKLARRYAQALLNVARNDFGAGRERELLDFAKNLNEFSTAVTANHELHATLISPMFERGGRGRVVAEVARYAGLSDLGVRILQIVFERDRIAYLPQITAAFVELAAKDAKIVDVAITVSAALSNEERGQVETTLRGCISGNPEFRWIVDPKILGGMIVRYDGKVVDGSIGGKLNRLEHELLP